MSRPLTWRPPRLLALFLVATMLPAVALAWLGWRLIAQDRLLERQRIQDFVDSTATSVIAALERDLGAIDRELGSATLSSRQMAGFEPAVAARLDKAGHARTIAGTPLLFEPNGAGVQPEPSPLLWVEGEQFEFVGHDDVAALAAYRRLAGAPDPSIRAGALIRLARIFRRTGRATDALEAYAALGRVHDATILGGPADLMARWARLELLATLNRPGMLQSEAASLDHDFRAGRWHLDETTAVMYATALAPWRTDAEAAAVTERLNLSAVVAGTWRSWQTRSAGGTVTGRAGVSAGTTDALIVWREHGDELLVFSATAAALAKAWRDLPSTRHVAIALVDERGRAIAGEIVSGIGQSVVKPASDTQLPWTLRATAMSAPPDIASAGRARRQVIGAVLAILAFLIPATGYLVLRAARKEMALAAQQAAFVSAVSHEFRSPLTSLTHLTSLLRSDFQPSERRRQQYYDALAVETDRLRRFVETLLDVGRMRAGATRYRLVQTDLGEALARVVDEFTHHTACGSHPVSLVVDSPVPSAAVDEEAFGRAIWNLLENAAKYSGDSTPITVQVQNCEQHIEIRVLDCGEGIPPSEQPFIFNQFFRGAAASQSAVKGTGVGLAVVRHVVAGHGGHITVESTVGRGTTFTIVLPIGLPRAPLTTTTESPEPRLTPLAKSHNAGGGA